MNTFDSSQNPHFDTLPWQFSGFPSHVYCFDSLDSSPRVSLSGPFFAGTTGAVHFFVGLCLLVGIGFCNVSGVLMCLFTVFCFLMTYS